MNDMIYTSRYANPELRKGIYRTVGISRGRPKFSPGYRESEHCYRLAPAGELRGLPHGEFSLRYRQGLDTMGPETVRTIMENLQRRAAGRDLVLLCFEDIRDPEQHCHRTVLAEWLKERLGLEVRELPDPSPVHYKAAGSEMEQTRLY